ncbi:MAG: Omp28-related outer membrane protein [Bacteroidota bacterium]|nr:Omp28-related outer membrane protein [Bacteroidota bacterium]
MKNFLTTFSLSICASAVMAQGIPVSQSPSNRVALLEEFTGVNCQYCPQGHSIADGLVNDNPGSVVAVNIHAGTFAPSNPDYRIQDGENFDGSFAQHGYPAGVVNRAQGNATLGRGEWAGQVSPIITQTSYVNLGMQADWDITTNEATITLQAYFTGNSPASSERLHLYLLQDDIEGPQSGAATYNPSEILPNGNYNHTKMLRNMFFGLNGITLPSNSAGSLFDTTFTITISDFYPSLSGNTNVMTEIGKMSFVLFTTHPNNRNVETAIKVAPNYTGLTALDASAGGASVETPTCGWQVNPKFSFSNRGQSQVTSLQVRYDINNGTEVTYTWTGQVDQFSSTEFTLPTYYYLPQPTNTITAEIIAVNGSADDVAANNIATSNFTSDASGYNTISINLDLQLDNWGSEVTWGVYDASGAFVPARDNVSGTTYSSPIVYADGMTAANNQFFYTINLNSFDCYSIVFEDSFGDGLSGAAPQGGIAGPTGSFSFTDPTSTAPILTGSGQSIGSGSSATFFTINATGGSNATPDLTETTDSDNDGVTDLDELNLGSNPNDPNSQPTSIDDLANLGVSIYPNPSTGIINLESASRVNYRVIDALGKVITSGSVEGSKSVNLSSAATGIYTLSIVDASGNVSSGIIEIMR